MANITELDKLKEELKNATHPLTIQVLQKKIKDLEVYQSAAEGDKIAQLMVAMTTLAEKYGSSTPTGQSSGGGMVSAKELENAVNEALKTKKIGLSNLDASLQSFLTQQAKIKLELKGLNWNSSQSRPIKVEVLSDPLFQKMLTDSLANNNIYLYGTAGSGKTFIATQLADFLGFQYIEINCNQYTSPLEIIGGQTIDGYQEGKLIRAWANLDETGKKDSDAAGSLLCIDEMPKIDPNTAGLFNSALAKVKDKRQVGNQSFPPQIENAKGEKKDKKPLVIVATGNLKLNEVSTEYEANFKQDLSLQDRFAGSTYRVDYNYKSEWLGMMEGFGFIFIACMRLRRKIIENKYTGFAFVSRRILANLRDTYIIYRQVKDNAVQDPVVAQTLTAPKSVIDGMNAFLSLFKPDQITILKQAMEYDTWVQVARQKDSLDMTKLDTPQELEIIEKLIAENQAEILKEVI